MKILFAEDETDLREAIAEYLEIQGHHVTAVGDGKQAVEKASKDAFDVMLLDIMMPVMDGITAIKEIRRAGNNVPAIFLTAKSQVSDKVEGLDAGADDYLAKPFAMEELNARLRALYRRKRDYLANVMKIGNVVLDTEQAELRAVNSISISYRETRLFEFLISKQGERIEIRELKDEVWSDENADASVIWMYVSFLREKLKAIQANVALDGDCSGPFVLKGI